MTGNTLLAYLAGLPNFLLYFISALILVVLFMAAYIRFTPYRELDLIRAGNSAAAVKLSGAVIGFTLPVVSLVSHSVSLLDMTLWGLVALIIQFSLYQTLRLLIKDLPQAIEEDKRSVGILAAALSLTIGMINAACLTY